eukprot:COSAG06_NODE_35796_length_455_cov_1.235955_1_plen_43_part_10
MTHHIASLLSTARSTSPRHCAFPYLQDSFLILDKIRQDKTRQE